MSYSPNLTSGFAATNNRSSHLTTTSGMCSMCVEGCATPCEIGLAAVLYFLMLVVLRALPYEDVLMLPKGAKLAKLLKMEKED